MKLRHLLPLFIVAFSVTNIYAKNVDKTTAEKVAKNYYYQQAHYFDTPISYDAIQFSDSYVKEINSTPVMYVFDIVDGGFILVSAEDAMYPVVGYCFDKDVKFDMESRGQNYKSFLTSMMEMIEQISKAKISQDTEIAEGWNTYTTDNPETLIATKEDAQVGPLLTSTWNQDYPYNYYAPLDPAGDGGRCYAGCVATAMAVIMHYWGYPYTGEGSTSYYSNYGILSADFGSAYYNWDAMPSSISEQSETDAVLNIAQIQYHCGVSVQMNFDPQGSGAQSSTVPYALHSYFKYPSANYYSRSNTDTWESTLISQLDQKLPLYYSGYSASEGGHAFGCDGYRIVGSTKTFHYNFNWGGYYNDWYSSSNPNGFSSGQAIVKDFYPDATQYPVYMIDNKELTSKVGRVDDGSGPVENYLSGTHNTWFINPQSDVDTVKTITLTWEKFALADGDVVNIYDGNSTGATLLASYSGTTLPESITSTGNKMYIEFVGNGSADGFVFTYKSNRDKWCKSTNTESNLCGTIVSNPEDKYYCPSTLCRWTIKYPQSTNGGYLKFNYLQTYDDKDFVTIYDLGTQELHTFYGTTPTENIPFSASGCLITFKTDAFIQEGNGFSLYYSDYSNEGISNYDFTELNVYPNPVSDKLNVTFTTNSDQNITYQIYDTKGMLINENSINSTSGSHHNTIDVSTLKSGVYFIKFIGSNSTSTKKFVVE